ncbi:MAG: PDZ domain-containing protein [Verrucomicrobia bacterium]|nr:PDZ domain-containing protein [Verrucomicrobiota bacterium]
MNPIFFGPLPMAFLTLTLGWAGLPARGATTAPAPPPAVSSSPIEVARSLGNAFAAIAEKVSPAVVVINVIRGTSGAEPFGFNPEEQPPDPFEFFHRGPRHLPTPQPYERESQGSGFIVRSDGYIYTNNHVIQGADKIKVKLKDGRTFDGQIVGVPDEKTDVAVIRIVAKDLPTVEMGDSDAIRPGEWTIAIGAPFNLDYSVTAGVLSGKYRDQLRATVYEEYLQTQATINPGNSGGPLLDIDGRVIGINTIIRTRPGGFNFYNANVGFAIPIKLAQKIGNLLITKGKVERPWIGIGIQTLSDAAELKTRTKGVEKGVVVLTLNPDTPSYDSGLEPGDVITAVDGVAVSSARDLQKQILEKKIGQVVRLSVVRDGAPLSVAVKTGLQPSTQQVAARGTPPPAPSEQPFGITVQPLTRELIEQFSLTEKQGLLVMDVEEESPAARAGMMPGMVIRQVDGKKVLTAQALKEALKQADPRRGAMIQITKDGIRSFVILKTRPTTQPEGN